MNIVENIIWSNDDPKWTENGVRESIAVVHVGHSNGHVNSYISCRTNWGWVDDPTDSGYGLKWDFPERFSEECRGTATVAYRALQEFRDLKQKYFAHCSFVVFEDVEDAVRYDNLLGLFFPQYRNDQWVNYLEVEGDE